MKYLNAIAAFALLACFGHAMAQGVDFAQRRKSSSLEERVEVKPVDTTSSQTSLAFSHEDQIRFDQIKVLIDSVKTIKGTLESRTWSTLTVNNGWKSIPVARSAIRSIELYRRDARGGVIRGAIVGTVIGFLVCVAINTTYGICHSGFGESKQDHTFVAVWSVPACTLVGSILGYGRHKKVATLTPNEFWERY